MLWAQDASARVPTDDERGRLRRLGDEPLVATLTLDDGQTIKLAASGDRKAALLGPFTPTPAASPISRTPTAAPGSRGPR